MEEQGSVAVQGFESMAMPVHQYPFTQSPQSKGPCLFPWCDISEMPAAHVCLYIGRSSPRQVQDAEQISVPLLYPTPPLQHMVCGRNEVKKNIKDNLEGEMKSSPKGNMQWNKGGVVDDKGGVGGLIIRTRNDHLPIVFQKHLYR